MTKTNEQIFLDFVERKGYTKEIPRDEIVPETGVTSSIFDSVVHDVNKKLGTKYTMVDSLTKESIEEALKVRLNNIVTLADKEKLIKNYLKDTKMPNIEEMVKIVGTKKDLDLVLNNLNLEGVEIYKTKKEAEQFVNGFEKGYNYKFLLRLVDEGYYPSIILPLELMTKFFNISVTKARLGLKDVSFITYDSEVYNHILIHPVPNPKFNSIMDILVKKWIGDIKKEHRHIVMELLNEPKSKLYIPNKISLSKTENSIDDLDAFIEENRQFGFVKTIQEYFKIVLYNKIKEFVETDDTKGYLDLDYNQVINHLNTSMRNDLFIKPFK